MTGKNINFVRVIGESVAAGLASFLVLQLFDRGLPYSFILALIIGVTFGVAGAAFRLGTD